MPGQGLYPSGPILPISPLHFFHAPSVAQGHIIHASSLASPRFAASPRGVPQSFPILSPRGRGPGEGDSCILGLGPCPLCDWSRGNTRLLKKAHLRHPSSGWVPGALPRRCDVRSKYASHLHPSCGWVPGAPPCMWAFFSSLGENGFFSILIEDVRVLVALRSFRVQMSRRASLDAPKTLHHTKTRKIERTTQFRDDRCRGEFVARLAALTDAGALPGLCLAHPAESRVAYLPNRPAPAWAVFLDREHLIEGASWCTCNIPHCRLLAAECPPSGTSVTIREESRIFLRIMSLDYFPDP